MKGLSTIVAAGALLLSRVAAMPAMQSSPAAPLPPKQDPFYTAPPNFQNAQPGEILRLRRAPGNLTAVIGNSSAAYNVLYRTTDSHYNPTWAVTTLFVPSKPAAGPGSLLTYGLAYDSADLNASPSYAMYQGMVPDVSDGLGRGWYVNVPDFEGNQASYAAGVLAGHATVDSVRAVRTQGFVVPWDARYALYGYSSGADAVEAAAELAVQYAPELAFAGVALVGLAPNYTGSIDATDGGPLSSSIPAGMVGLATMYPQLEQLILSSLNPTGPYNKSAFLATVNYTLAEAETHFSGEIGNYFKQGRAIFSEPAWTQAVDMDAILGTHGTPTAPLYFFSALVDEVSPITYTDALVNQYCADGANIVSQRNAIGGHVAAQENGDPGAVAFLESVFAGKYNHTGCTVEETAVAINPAPY